MEEEKPKTAEKPPQTCPPFTQTFLQLNASTSDAIEISFMLENTLGMIFMLIVKPMKQNPFVYAKISE